MRGNMQMLAVNDMLLVRLDNQRQKDPVATT